MILSKDRLVDIANWVEDDFLSAQEKYVNLKNVSTELYQNDTIENSLVDTVKWAVDDFSSTWEK